MNYSESKNVTERFLKYVSFYTTSDEDSETSPSTARQKVLGQYLADELKSLGLSDAHMDEYGYVYAHLAANGSDEEPLGLIAHMDTAPSAPGENIKPRVIRYDGGDIDLGNGVATRESDFPSLRNYVGQDLIVTDGTTLLGADDKAGMAEIVTLVELLLAHPEIKRRAVSVCFTPDEEIGRGTDHFDARAFGAKRGYTVDGGPLGELEYENFNAAAARITVKGLNIHPGSAKNKMRNAALMAAEFISSMPEAETPAHTEGYEGFYHLCEMRGDENEAVLKYIIRDHDREKFEARKGFMRELTTFLNAKYHGGFVCEIRDSYYNMKGIIDTVPEMIENARAAFLSVGVDPAVIPIRGGTDGAMLSYKGIPCPNLSTGGENFHGVNEFVSVQSMEKMVEVLAALVSR